jgi:hypothetical protein
MTKQNNKEDIFKDANFNLTFTEETDGTATISTLEKEFTKPTIDIAKWCIQHWKDNLKTYQSDKNQLLAIKQQPTVEGKVKFWKHVMEADVFAECLATNTWPNDKTFFQSIDSSIAYRTELIKKAKAELKHNQAILKRLEEEAITAKFNNQKRPRDGDSSGGSSGMVV